MMGKSSHGNGSGKPRRHPLRTIIRMRLVAALTQRDLTPLDLARALRLPPKARRRISRHLQALEEADYVRVVSKEIIRGLQTYRYTAIRPALVHDTDFAKMTLNERKRTSMGFLMDFFAACVKAWRKGSMDAQIRSHLTWKPAKLDQQGFDDTMALLGRTYEAVQEIEAESIVRRRKNGDRLVPTVVGLAGFEGPPEDGR